MGSKTWIYITILIIVLAAGGVFFWWMYKTSKITPKAEVPTTTTAPAFSDVASDYWAYNQIEAVNKAGYMVGFHEFKPDQKATRADAAAAVAKAYSKSYDNTTPSFPDVPATYWAYKEIEGLKQAGIIQGYSDGNFKPDQVISREELAVLIGDAYASTGAGKPVPAEFTIPFSDVTLAANSAAFKAIFYVYDNDLMSGYPDGTFQPTQSATRADVAVAVARAKNGGDAAVPAATTQTFIDVPPTNAAYKYIEYDNSISAMIGYPPVFKPDDFADRATVAAAIARAVAGSDSAVPERIPATSSYSDVPTTHWASKYIEYLKSKDIMKGYDDGTFKPDNPPEYAQRYTITVVLARAKNLDLSSPPAAASFVDVPTTYPYFAEIEANYKAGYTQGLRQDSTGIYFCPDTTTSGQNGQLTRAQLAYFTYNAYIKIAVASPSVVSPSPVVSPTTPPPTPTPTPTEEATAVETPATTAVTEPTTTTTTTSKPATTGAEIPLAGGGLLGLLFLGRYLVGKRIK